MENCLVSQLNTVADVENPQFAREIKIQVAIGSNDKKLYVTTTDGDVRFVLPKQLILTSNQSVTLEEYNYTNRYTLERNKRHLITISPSESRVFYFSIVGFAFITELRIVDSVSDIRLIETKDLEYCVEMTSFAGDNFLNTTSIKGTLSNLSKFPKCATMDLGNSKLGGTVESFAEGGWSIGRRNGSLIVNHLGSSQNSVTFNNSPIINNSDWKFIFSNSGVVVQQPEGTKVATYDGTTWTYV